MDIERERGITIKAQTVLDVQPDGETYQLNLDTPGYVDLRTRFRARQPARAAAYRRSVAGCRGADAGQFVSRHRRRLKHFVQTKIDLLAAEPERVRQEIEDVVGLAAEDTTAVSAKTAEGISKR